MVCMFGSLLFTIVWLFSGLFAVVRGVPGHLFAHRGEDAPHLGVCGARGCLLVVCCLFYGSVEVEVHKRPRSVWLVVSRPRVTGPLGQGVPT